MDAETNHAEWAGRSGRFSPTYYAELGPNRVSRTLGRLLASQSVAPDDTILELGCSSGRHLAHLLEAGFEDLQGIDINPESFGVMTEYFPELAETGTFHTGRIEELVPEFETDAVEVVYSVQTLQHVHPDHTWVFDEVARVTNHLLITVENEGRGPGVEADAPEQLVSDEIPLYHRDWGDVFESRGFVQIDEATERFDTVRIFASAPDH